MNQTDYMTVGTVRNGGSIKGNGKGVYSLIIRQDGSIQETGLLEADSIRTNMLMSTASPDFNVKWMDSFQSSCPCWPSAVS